MSEHLVEFPARFAFTNPDGTLTNEARRMLRGWFMSIVEPAASSEITAMNVFAARQTSQIANAALEGNGNQIIGAAAFLPKTPTFTASVSLESNSNAILAGQIFGA